MIAGFRDEWLRAFFVDDVRSRNIPPDLELRLFRKLQMIDDATTDLDLRVPPSNHFEKLRGNLEGFHSIRVNKQWRLVFRWDGRRGEASGVYLDDHSYR
ncbi:type II toxin-antitoxin system RelE/ParE family toxin [Mesorhizobium sp. M1E.F.Ca.ET.045.02.1.1]|uniref:type II toxin-antitoxin system RelE/ParE family toxin n=1 Tax=unclassified Mesorhizobium TaxID=325217 RepID=UPI000F75E7CD|nr:MULTISPECIES: type II toxin-antitoxin system RelE/ParE family toxin [unclassified Mesorhizobium]AZO21128.1 type II toxin-antitoxin system RelE/ParE family toxin [Mesorhizobium sp. M1E.F.Ca.ET.045.02.1.1]RUW82944.1 type II toxin-antitoxin system RelE/ParE family toxin [Mesorhizobium sp. M1E.F.Ca.ET.063.01.1.1]TKB17067.1 MAG: type II toxin-antitoxin system RelE/ParE family toxin [Mesorhizobium sp.]